MPGLELRGRYVLREYWSDSDLFLRLTAEQREVYIGLWMLGDDEGFLPRDVEQISAALFRFQSPTERKALVTDAIARLVKLEKVKSLRCCLEVPAVRRYPRPGKKSTVHYDAHRAHSIRKGSNGVERIQTDSILLPDPTIPIPRPRPDPARGHARERVKDPEPETARDILRRFGGNVS